MIHLVLLHFSSSVPSMDNHKNYCFRVFLVQDLMGRPTARLNVRIWQSSPILVANHGPAQSSPDCTSRLRENNSPCVCGNVVRLPLSLTTLVFRGKPVSGSKLSELSMPFQPSSTPKSTVLEIPMIYACDSSLFVLSHSSPARLLFFRPP